ncbi:DUF2064 domain-containing protein [Streptomyces sp. MUM 136J]|nr:DUF2064 domain-containing protein [Streptomyces sp. MUM 2J]MCH0571845.1 DUF2064 domain-containing protein [Streptomyces sp. MUM 136J]
MGPATLLVLAKEPVPGQVKTRLTPPYTPREAAALAEAALTDTLHTLLRAPVRRRVLVLDETPGPWLPPGFEVAAQVSGVLDERIVGAFGLCDGGPALLVGMDTPQLTADLLSGVGRGGHDACFVPASDGGFWALGPADPARAGSLVRGVPMSTDRTCAVQRLRLTQAGPAFRDLPLSRDVDTAADAAAVAGRYPRTSRFATAMASLAQAVR